jgi:uncharacterized membrane protein
MADSLIKKLASDPAAQDLLDKARQYGTARATHMVSKIGPGKIAEMAGGGAKGGAVEAVAHSASGGKGNVGQFLGGLGGAVKGLFKGKSRGANKPPTNIVEDLFIGLPVEQVYEKWHDYAAHAGYTKGVVGVDVDEADEGDEEQGREEQQEETNWRVKVWWSNRSWKSTTVEDVPNARIRWKTEGDKGTVDGVISFTPLGENLTLMLVVIEYRSKGFFEWTANRWRTAGRRVRLDLKHFRRFVMMEEQEKGTEQSRDDAEHDEDGTNGDRPGERRRMQQRRTERDDEGNGDRPGERRRMQQRRTERDDEANGDRPGERRRMQQRRTTRDDHEDAGQAKPLRRRAPAKANRST